MEHPYGRVLFCFIEVKLMHHNCVIKCQFHKFWLNMCPVKPSPQHIRHHKGFSCCFVTLLSLGNHSSVTLESLLFSVIILGSSALFHVSVVPSFCYLALVHCASCNTSVIWRWAWRPGAWGVAWVGIRCLTTAVRLASCSVGSRGLLERQKRELRKGPG